MEIIRSVNMKIFSERIRQTISKCRSFWSNAAKDKIVSFLMRYHSLPNFYALKVDCVLLLKAIYIPVSFPIIRHEQEYSSYVCDMDIYQTNKL